MTYSLVVRDGHQWGVAVQSKSLAVGSFVPSAEPEVGAIATQAYANPHYGPQGLALLREGLSAAEVVARLVGVDDRRDERQVGVVDADGGRAAWTGPSCLDWAGHRAGDGYAAQGNILVGARRWTRSPRRSRRPLGRSRSACSTASTPRRKPAVTAAVSSRRRSSSSSATEATRSSPTSPSIFEARCRE